jgi:hypothetical protein
MKTNTLKLKNSRENPKCWIMEDLSNGEEKSLELNDNWITLNPFEKRGYTHSINELIKSKEDMDRVVGSILTINECKEGGTWLANSRTILEGIILLSMEKGENSNSDLLKYIGMGRRNLLKEMKKNGLKDSKAYTLLFNARDHGMISFIIFKNSIKPFYLFIEALSEHRG